jgi:hypothetical protein
MKRKEPDQCNDSLNLNSDKNHKKNISGNIENMQRKYMEFAIKNSKNLDEIGKRMFG